MNYRVVRDVRIKHVGVSLIAMFALSLHAYADQPAKSYVSMDLQATDIVGNLPHPYGESRLHIEYEMGEVVKVSVDSNVRSWTIPFKLIESYEDLSLPSLQMAHTPSSKGEDISILVALFDYGDPKKMSVKMDESSRCPHVEWVRPVVKFLLMPDGSVNAEEIFSPQ